MDNAQIKADFNELYHRMKGMELREMDKIIILSVRSAGIMNVLALWRVLESVCCY